MAAPGRSDHNVSRLLDQCGRRTAAQRHTRGTRRREHATSVLCNAGTRRFGCDQDRLGSPNRPHGQSSVGAWRSQIHRMTVEAHAHAGVGAKAEHRPPGWDLHADPAVAHDLRCRPRVARGGCGVPGRGRHADQRYEDRDCGRARQMWLAGSARDHDTTHNSPYSRRLRSPPRRAPCCSRASPRRVAQHSHRLTEMTPARQDVEVSRLGLSFRCFTADSRRRSHRSRSPVLAGVGLGELNTARRTGPSWQGSADHFRFATRAGSRSSSSRSRWVCSWGWPRWRSMPPSWYQRHHQAQVVADSAALAAANCLANPTAAVPSSMAPRRRIAVEHGHVDESVAVAYASANGLAIRTATSCSTPRTVPSRSPPMSAGRRSLRSSSGFSRASDGARHSLVETVGTKTVQQFRLDELRLHVRLQRWGLQYGDRAHRGLLPVTPA